MNTPAPALGPAEVAERGRRVYEEELRERLEPDHLGQLITIDVLTGDYEVAELDDDGVRAAHRLRERRPDGVFYGLRVGYPAAINLSFFE